MDQVDELINGLSGWLKMDAWMKFIIGSMKMVKWIERIDGWSGWIKQMDYWIKMDEWIKMSKWINGSKWMIETNGCMDSVNGFLMFVIFIKKRLDIHNKSSLLLKSFWQSDQMIRKKIAKFFKE
jgi:hypothetical protein